MASYIIRNCPHCPASNSAFEVKWTVKSPQDPVALVFAATCGACGLPISGLIRAANGVQNQGLNAGNAEPLWAIQAYWPTRAPSRAPDHTPDSVAKRFVQGENAYARGDWNAAVAMYRSALDIGTRGLQDVPQGLNFYQRTVWLNDNHRITPDLRAWADKVRVEGNNALHDLDDFNEVDTKPLRFFTEMFLRYIFELPGEVAAHNAQEGD